MLLEIEHRNVLWFSLRHNLWFLHSFNSCCWRSNIVMGLLFIFIDLKTSCIKQFFLLVLVILVAQPICVNIIIHLFKVRTAIISILCIVIPLNRIECALFIYLLIWRMLQTLISVWFCGIFDSTHCFINIDIGFFSSLEFDLIGVSFITALNVHLVLHVLSDLFQRVMCTWSILWNNDALLLIHNCALSDLFLIHGYRFIWFDLFISFWLRTKIEYVLLAYNSSLWKIWPMILLCTSFLWFWFGSWIGKWTFFSQSSIHFW